MKNLVFGLTIAIATLFFSCASDSSTEAGNNQKIDNISAEQLNVSAQNNLAKLDTISSLLDQTSKTINQNIKALNTTEAELLKEFDLN